MLKGRSAKCCLENISLLLDSLSSPNTYIIIVMLCLDDTACMHAWVEAVKQVICMWRQSPQLQPDVRLMHYLNVVLHCHICQSLVITASNYETQFLRDLPKCEFWVSWQKCHASIQYCGVRPVSNHACGSSHDCVRRNKVRKDCHSSPWGLLLSWGNAFGNT